MQRLACLLILALAGCATPPPKMTAGTKGPTVVFEAGSGNGADVWNRVRLPQGVPRFAWTRAGSGAKAIALGTPLWASDGDGKRTGAEVAAHLQAALDAAGAHPPYLLVAHSIGASYALTYAKLHPDRIAGIVLVDPRLPGFTERCKAEGLHGCEVPPLLLPLLSPAERVELRGAPDTEAALADLSALRDIPLTILVGTRRNLGEGPNWRRVWLDHAKDFAARFSDARIVTVDSPHHIQLDEPDVVSREIRLRLTPGQPRPAARL